MTDDVWTSLPAARSVLRLDMAGAVLSAAMSIAVTKFNPERQGPMRLVKACVVSVIAMLYQLNLIWSFPQPYLRYRSVLAMAQRLQFVCVLVTYFSSESYKTWVNGLPDAPSQASQMYGLFFANACHAIAIGVLFPLPWKLQVLTYTMLASAQLTGLRWSPCLPAFTTAGSVYTRLCEGLSARWSQAPATCGAQQTMLQQLLFIIVFFATAVPLIMCYLYEQHLQWAVQAEQGRRQRRASIKAQLITLSCVPVCCYIICIAVPFVVPVTGCHSM